MCLGVCLSSCLCVCIFCMWVRASVCKCVCPPNSDHRQIKGWIVDPSTKWALPLQWDFVAMFSALQKPQDAPSTSQRPYCKSGSALNATFCTTFADYLEHMLVRSAVRTPSAHSSYSSDFKLLLFLRLQKPSRPTTEGRVVRLDLVVYEANV